MHIFLISQTRQYHPSIVKYINSNKPIFEIQNRLKHIKTKFSAVHLRTSETYRKANECGKSYKLDNSLLDYCVPTSISKLLSKFCFDYLEKVLCSIFL